MQNCLENMFLLYCHSVMTQTTFISFNNKDSFSSRQDLKMLWKCQSSSNSGVLLKLGRCSPGIFQIAGGNYKTPFKLGPSETILQIILNKNKQQTNKCNKTFPLERMIGFASKAGTFSWRYLVSVHSSQLQLLPSTITVASGKITTNLSYHKQGYPKSSLLWWYFRI